MKQKSNNLWSWIALHKVWGELACKNINETENPNIEQWKPIKQFKHKKYKNNFITKHELISHSKKINKLHFTVLQKLGKMLLSLGNSYLFLLNVMFKMCLILITQICAHCLGFHDYCSENHINYSIGPCHSLCMP